jgi:hypothetical protein
VSVPDTKSCGTPAEQPAEQRAMKKQYKRQLRIYLRPNALQTAVASATETGLNLSETIENYILKEEANCAKKNSRGQE